MRQTSTKKLFTGGESNKNASPRAKLFTAGESYKNASPRNDANQDQSQQNVKNSKPIPDKSTDKKKVNNALSSNKNIEKESAQIDSQNQLANENSKDTKPITEGHKRTNSNTKSMSKSIEPGQLQGSQKMMKNETIKNALSKSTLLGAIDTVVSKSLAPKSNKLKAVVDSSIAKDSPAKKTGFALNKKTQESVGKKQLKIDVVEVSQKNLLKPPESNDEVMSKRTYELMEKLKMNND